MRVVLQTTLYIPNKVRHAYKKGPKRDPNLAASTNFRDLQAGPLSAGGGGGAAAAAEASWKAHVPSFWLRACSITCLRVEEFQRLGLCFSESWALGLQG